MKFLFVVVVGLVANIGCGVKGDPLPPEAPPTIGRGHPTYRKAAERYQIRTEPTADEENKKDEDKKEVE